MERDVQHLRDPERDRGADLVAPGHDVDAHAVGERQRTLDALPVAEPDAQDADQRADVRLLGEGEIAARYGYVASRTAA